MRWNSILAAGYLCNYGINTGSVELGFFLRCQWLIIQDVFSILMISNTISLMFLLDYTPHGLIGTGGTAVGGRRRLAAVSKLDRYFTFCFHTCEAEVAGGRDEIGVLGHASAEEEMGQALRNVSPLPNPVNCTFWGGGEIAEVSVVLRNTKDSGSSAKGNL